jgi:hypothetical protein
MIYLSAKVWLLFFLKKNIGMDKLSFFTDHFQCQLTKLNSKLNKFLFVSLCLYGLCAMPFHRSTVNVSGIQYCTSTLEAQLYPMILTDARTLNIDMILSE